MSNPIIGFTTTWGVNDGASSAQQVFAMPITVSIPFGEVGVVDAAHMAMTDRFRIKIPGLIDGGKLTGEMIYNKADYNRLVTLRGSGTTAGTVKNWQVVVPTDGVATLTATVPGFLTKCELSVENETLLKIKVEVEVSGAITVA